MALSAAMSAPPPNAALVARIRAREDEAATDLVRRFGRGVSVILRRVVREPAAVDDLYQDTFRLTIEKIRRGDPRDPERLPGFVAALARNLAIDHLRRRARRRVEDVEAAAFHADPGPSPLDRLLDRERAALARRVMDDLYQDTFRLTIEKIRRGDPRDPERLPGFVAALARNLAIDHLRRRSRRKVEDVETAESFADPGPSPLDRLLDRERAALARQVIDDLGSDRDREVLYRFYIAEEDKDVICRQLDLTSLHFNRVLHRARQRYRELFEAAVRRTAGGSA